MMTNWKREIEDAMSSHGETWSDVVAKAFEFGDELTEFDPGFGGRKGSPFTVWTHCRVYFPAVYDRSEWCESVPRNPCEVATCHVGDE